MIGQDFVVATLQKSIAAGKIAHAYLFSGSRGCGKTSSARILAKALNCDKGPGATPCGICPSCVEITRGASLDVIEIDGASNTSVNDVRQIKDEVQFPPNSCRYKVYIIDEVHMLSTSAFNALLKTIEEPPPYVIFIFATTELHKVPATIKSRCQQFNFRLVPVEQLKNVLSAAAAETGIHAEEEALFWIAREATGSVRDAYTLFDQVTSFSDGHLTFEKIRDKLGLVGVDRINPIVEACAERDLQAALLLLDDILQSGVSIEQFTVDLADYFRNLLLIKSGITRESLLGQSVDRFSSKLLAAWNTVQLERSLGIMLQLFRDIRYSLDPRYELELAVSRLSWITDYVSSAEMKAAIIQARSLLQGGSAAKPSSPVSPASPRGSPAGGDSGPFSDADRSIPVTPETIRGEINGTDVDAIDTEERIDNPFAAFKERLRSGYRADTEPVKPAAFEPPEVSSTQSSSSSGISSAVGAAVPSGISPASGAPLATSVSSPASAHLAANVPPPANSAPLPASVPLAPTAATAAANVSALPADFAPLAGFPDAVPFDKLQESLVSYFQNTKNMVATSLSQSFDWKDTGAIVSFAVDKPFVYNFLEQDHKQIAEAVSALLRRTVGIEIRIDSSKTAGASSEEPGVPPQVEMLRQMFRGTIIGAK
jgi:DNA polymerase-3 subunit gamma/tau